MIVIIDMICLCFVFKGIEILLVKCSNLNCFDCGFWVIFGGWVFDEDFSV